MVGSFRKADDVAGLGMGENELGFGIIALRHIDRDRQLRRVDRLVAQDAHDAQAAGIEDQPLARGLARDRDLLGRASEPESGMDDISAVGQGKRRRGLRGFRDKFMRTVRLGRIVEDPPFSPLRTGCASEALRMAESTSALRGTSGSLSGRGARRPPRGMIGAEGAPANGRAG